MAKVALQIDTNDDVGGSRYVAGDSNDDAQIRKLIKQIDVCLKRWGNDPGYEKVAHRLREAKYELEFICATPGHKEALRASNPHVSSGQGPDRKSEY